MARTGDRLRRAVTVLGLLIAACGAPRGDVAIDAPPDPGEDALRTCPFEVGDPVFRDGVGAQVPPPERFVAGEHYGTGEASATILVSTSADGVVFISPPGESCLLAGSVGWRGEFSSRTRRRLAA